jgi:hypothetical protein
MRTLLKKMIFIANALALACLACGCSTFNRDWERAASLPPSSDGISGRWQGTWKSDASGHHDKLRCIMTPDAQKPGTYDAFFHAIYRGTVSFHYTVPLTVEKRDGTNYFNGTANLGWLAGGVYHYDGGTAGTNFFSTYTSKYDHGTFQMRRP